MKLPKNYHPDFRIPGRKPVGDVEVDWDHPLAKGLVFCQLLDQRFLSRDIISGNTLQYGNGSKEDYKPHMGEFGLYAGTRTASLGTAGYSIPNDLNLTGDHTILARVKIPSEANTYLCDGRAHAGGTYYLLDGVGNLNVGGQLHAVGGSQGSMGNIALVTKEGVTRSFRDGEFKNSRGVTGDIRNGFRIFSRYNDKENLEFGSSFWVFNRALSDAEAKELSKNPYQILKPANPIRLPIQVSGGGGPTPVTADLTAQWNLLQAVQSDANLQWSLLNAVQQSADLQWSILNSVQQDADLQWSIIQAVQQDADLQWNILAALSSVQSDLTAQWSILEGVFADSESRWSILNSVFSDSEARWSILNSVLSDADLRWNVLSALSSVSSDLELRWDMSGQVFSSLTAQWNIFNAVTSDADLRWSILNAISQDLSTRWDVVEAVQAGADLRWDIIAATDSTLTLRWNIASETQFPDLEGVITLESKTPVFTVSSLTPKITVH